jgi:hypothetical protein
MDVEADARARVDGLDWTELNAQLDDNGYAVTPPVFGEGECQELADLLTTIARSARRSRWPAIASVMDATATTLTHCRRRGPLRRGVLPISDPHRSIRAAACKFHGGDFILLEQRPCAQSRAHVLIPEHGAFVVFPTAERPNRGARGYHRVGMRHGVSTVSSGQRTALGVIFHDAK